MITFKSGASGTFKVEAMERNLEYMTVGETYSYEVDNSGYDVSWKRASGAGSFGRVKLLNIFQQQGRLVLSER
jgi:hypothetical protein